MQARAATLPAFGATTQYIGNQESPALRTGRFVSMDGVNMYRAWITAPIRSSRPVRFLAALRRKAEAAAQAARRRLDIAEQRGGSPSPSHATITDSFQPSVKMRHGATGRAAGSAAFLRRRPASKSALGQVAHSDVVKAEISYRQQQQAFDESALAMDNARLSLAVLIFPAFSENFSVVDDHAELCAGAASRLRKYARWPKRGNP